MKSLWNSFKSFALQENPPFVAQIIFFVFDIIKSIPTITNRPSLLHKLRPFLSASNRVDLDLPKGLVDPDWAVHANPSFQSQYLSPV